MCEQCVCVCVFVHVYVCVFNLSTFFFFDALLLRDEPYANISPGKFGCIQVIYVQSACQQSGTSLGCALLSAGGEDTAGPWLANKKTN